MLGGGFRRQDLVVLGGDVGSGKSALGLAIALRSASAGVPTLVLSGEMSPERVLERALALEGRAPIDDLRQGRLDAAARASVGAAAVRLRDIPLLLRPLGSERFEDIAASLDQVPGRSLSGRRFAAAHAGPASRGATRRAGGARRPRAQGAGGRARRGAARTGAAARPSARPRGPASRPRRLWGRRERQAEADLVLAIYREEMYGPDRAWKARRSSSSPRTATGRRDSWTCTSIPACSGSRTCSDPESEIRHMRRGHARHAFAAVASASLWPPRCRSGPPARPIAGPGALPSSAC